MADLVAHFWARLADVSILTFLAFFRPKHLIHRSFFGAQNGPPEFKKLNFKENPKHDNKFGPTPQKMHHFWAATSGVSLKKVTFFGAFPPKSFRARVFSRSKLKKREKTQKRKTRPRADWRKTP